jgi:hypothetical protein
VRPIVVTVGPLAAAAPALYAASQTPVSGTPLTLTGTLADQGRRALLTYGAEGAARSLILTGKNASGDVIGETLAVPSGGAGTVQSVLDYVSISKALPLGGGWTAAVTLGTNGVASSPWIFLDNYGFPQTALQVVAVGTVNYTVEQSLDDPNVVPPLPVVLPQNVAWFPHPVLAAQTGSAQDNYGYVPKMTRITLNSGTGSVTYTVIQATAPLRF